DFVTSTVDGQQVSVPANTPEGRALAAQNAAQNAPPPGLSPLTVQNAQLTPTVGGFSVVPQTGQVQPGDTFVDRFGSPVQTTAPTSQLAVEPPAAAPPTTAPSGDTFDARFGNWGVPGFMDRPSTTLPGGVYTGTTVAPPAAAPVATPPTGDTF